MAKFFNLITLDDHFRMFEAQCKKARPSRWSSFKNTFFEWPYIKKDTKKTHKYTKR